MSRRAQPVTLEPTFLATFQRRVREHPERVFMRQADSAARTGYRDVTFREADEQARRIAAALYARGLRRGERVGILSKNCWHWIVADLAILMLGAVSVPYYPTLSALELREVINLSEIKALFVGKLDDFAAQAPGVPAAVIKIAFPAYGSAREPADCERWDALLVAHSPLLAAHEPQPDEIFTILYTSGTTGTPKGAVLRYASPLALAQLEAAHPVYGIFQGNAARVLSYLPLNHVAERFATEITGILAGSTIYFAESVERFAHNLREAQPSMFFAVPRIWTKLREGITARIPEHVLMRLLALPLLGALLARTLRKQLGLGAARLVLSGAAPLSAELHAFFAKLGIHIQEVYGMTEVGGAATVSARAERDAGVGRPLPTAEVRLAPETDEILIRAPWMMTEYFRDPERTAQVLQHGFVHSGDRGRFDARGNLHVIGRINDTFKTSKGKFVVPAQAEASIAGWAQIDQVLVTGRGLPQPIALVSLSQAAQAQPREQLQAELEQLLRALNAGLAPHERLSHLVVLDEPFSMDNGLLTPTLKIRRHGVDGRFERSYEAWIKHPAPIVWPAPLVPLPARANA